MSLEALTAGMLALRGISSIAQLIRSARAPEIAERLSSGEPLSQAEFEHLLDRLLEISRESGSEGEGLLAALGEAGEMVSPLLFEALDADGSGEIDGDELIALERLVSHIQRGLPEGAAARVGEEFRLAT